MKEVIVKKGQWRSNAITSALKKNAAERRQERLQASPRIPGGMHQDCSYPPFGEEWEQEWEDWETMVSQSRIKRD